MRYIYCTDWPVGKMVNWQVYWQLRLHCRRTPMPGCQWAARVWFWEGLSRSSWFFLSSSSSGRWASCPLRRAYRQRPRPPPSTSPCAKSWANYMYSSTRRSWSGLPCVFGGRHSDHLACPSIIGPCRAWRLGHPSRRALIAPALSIWQSRLPSCLRGLSPPHRRQVKERNVGSTRAALVDRYSTRYL